MFIFPDFVRAQDEALPEFPELKENDIIHLATDLKISDKELINIVSASRVIYIGETHDNFSVHPIAVKGD